MKTTCSIILCADRAWTEDNGKIGMVGIFDNFNLNKFPAQLFPFSVYIRLLNVMKGNNKVIIRLIQEKTKIIIATVIAEFDLKIDQEILQFHAPLPPIVIPASGKYYIEVNCNNDIIAKHIIAVIESTSN